MQVLITVWNFIISHWSDLAGALTTAKLGADTIDSIKKVLPNHLETTKLTQDYLETSKTILNDQSKSVEDKKWELATRQEMVKSMVQLTAIDVTYHIASATVLAAFFTVSMQFFMRIVTRRREL